VPTKNFRAFYRGLDDAVEGLYRDELLTLADDEKTPDFGFDSRVFERAAEWVRERGGFTGQFKTSVFLWVKYLTILM
jgi:hypothetical protein